MLREWLRARSRLGNHLFNNWVIWPVIFAFANGYFMPLAFFGVQDVVRSTELFVGMMLLHIFVLSYTAATDMINERLESKILQYHTQATSYAAMFWARYMFNVLFSFASVIPFFPVAKLVLQEYLYTDLVCWWQILVVLFLGVCLANAYIFCWLAIITRVIDFEHIWERGIEPFLWLGGGWAPGYAIVAGAGAYGSWVYLNPFVYISDALRVSFLGDTVRFTPFYKALPPIVLGTLFFAIISYQLLKKRMDVV